MNPHQKNKIDISSLSEDEQRLFRLYGKLPNKKDLLQNKFKVSTRTDLNLHNFHHPHQTRISADHQGYCHQERKYFDSGDYALSKAGKATDVGVTTIGSQHPLPENIPHLSSPGPHPNGAANGNSLTGNGQQGTQSGSPVKESSFLHRETSVDDPENQRDGAGEAAEESVSPPPVKEGVPIRWQ